MSDQDFEDLPPLEDQATAYIPQTNSQIADVSMETPVECSDDDTDDDENEWEEQPLDASELCLSAKCFFCPNIQPNPCSVFGHMAQAHQFDMFVQAAHWDLDQVSYIKFINYVRTHNPSPAHLLKSEAKMWQSPDYMKAVSNGDTMLTFDVEDFFEDNSDEDLNSDVVTLNSTCDHLRGVVKKQGEALARLLDLQQKDGSSFKTPKTVSEIDEEEDKGYFNSYAYYDIHHEMLSVSGDFSYELDKVRTESYRSAILDNKPVFDKKCILDLGCGTGILSMFAAQAGGRVTGVDMSNVIYQAMAIIEENKLDDRITLRKGRLEDMKFPVKFDVIVSEWMGYFLLFEGMLDSVIYARKNHLAPGGILLPNRCTLYLVGADDIESHKKYVTFWNDVYGFKMTCLGKEAIKEATTEVVDSKLLCTTPAQIADFNLMTINAEDTEFSRDFEMTFEKDGQLTSFIGYFDTFFELPHAVMFSTGPKATPTHWRQTIFFLPKVRPCKKGEILKGKITLRKKRKELRSLDVLIMFEDEKYRYFVE